MSDPQETNTDRIEHFVPGQILFFARHRRLDEDKKREEEKIRAAIERIRKNDDLEDFMYPIRLDSILQFDDVSLSPPWIRQLNAAREPLIFSVISGNVDNISNEQLVDMIIALNRKDRADNGADRTGLELLLASPNWLSSGASALTPASPVHTPTGGPGGEPIPVLNPLPGAHMFRLPANLDNDGKGIHVAILDTAPSDEMLNRALAHWPNHPIIQGLLGPNGKLERPVRRPSPEIIAYLNRKEELYYPYCHRYKMIDHGIFVAGIIHTIAPQATLHLIEVLNDYGVGTYETFARGIQELKTINAPLIANCSLTINLPIDEKHPSSPLVEKVLDQVLSKRSATIESMEATTVRAQIEFSIKKICAWLHCPGMVVIAAAGNDGASCQPGTVSGRPEARYPARMPSILGVSALVGEEPANYANRCDLPERHGITTFGGGITSEGKTSVETGMLGVFISNPNDYSNGWAKWAGTSFSTAIISGAAARLLGAKRDSEQGDLENELFSRCEKKGAPNDEAIFRVIQGPIPEPHLE